MMVAGEVTIRRHIACLKSRGLSAEFFPDFVPITFRFGDSKTLRSHSLVRLPIGIGGRAWGSIGHAFPGGRGMLQVDTDGDGMLTEKELNAAVENPRARRH